MNRKYKAKGLKRRRRLLAVGRANINLNMLQMKTRDGREIPPKELQGIPRDRDQNLILEWYE